MAALPLVDEQLHVTKRDVVTETVRVRTVVDTREQVVREALRSENVTVTRVPVDRIVDVAPEIRTEGGLTVIPVLEEVLVVQTKLLLKEEVHIRRTSTEEAVERSVPLRTQRVIVETEAGDGRASGDRVASEP